MAHDKIGPHEQRLRELRQEREARARAAEKSARQLIPYAGKERTFPGSRYSPNARKTSTEKTK